MSHTNTSKDPFEDDHIPSPGRNDDDFNSSDAAKEASGSDSDWGSELSEFSDDRRRKREEKWNRSTPDGARRSKRQRTAGDNDDMEMNNRQSKPGRPSRSVSHTVGGASTMVTNTTVNNNTNSDEDEDDNAANVFVSPSNIVLKRDIHPEQVDEQIKDIRDMWEMAAVLDFLHLFRRQLNIQRQFAAEELERVLVTSVGDEGLLADVHIDIMRGISPKNVINSSNWQIHLANKIKFHWRNLSDGTPCPFKPEKYYESLTYAELPAAQRVRALHFICCVRCDREDIQLRIFKSEQPKTQEQIDEAEAAVEAARQRASRGTRSAKAVEEPDLSALETLETFRREPTGVDSSGIAYYYYDMIETYGFRLYREIPLSMVSSSRIKSGTNKGSQAGEKDEDGDDNDGMDDGGEDDDGKDGESPGNDGDGGSEDEQHHGATDADGNTSKSVNEAKMSKKQRERALRKMPLIKASTQIRDPPPPGRWELAATTLEELQAMGERFLRSMKSADKSLGHLFLEELIPQLQEKAESEERRRRAAERVRSRLGVEINPEELTVGGRSRRERRQVNYAFTDYDDMLRSAIRRTQRGGDEGWDDGTRRSGRHSSPAFALDDVEAARAGMRRGRSVAVLKAEEGSVMQELDERALRMLVAKRRRDGGLGSAEGDDDHEQRMLQEQGQDLGMSTEGDVDGGSGDGVQRMEEPRQVTGTRTGRPRGRPRGSTNRRYQEYVADFQDSYVDDGADDDDDDQEARYIPRPSRTRGGGGSMHDGGGVGQGHQEEGTAIFQQPAAGRMAGEAPTALAGSHQYAGVGGDTSGMQQQQLQYQQALFLYQQQQQLLLQQQHQQGMFAAHAMYGMPMEEAAVAPLPPPGHQGAAAQHNNGEWNIDDQSHHQEGH